MQNLFYPDLKVQIGKYVFQKGISLKLCSDKKLPYDWGNLRFTEEFQPSIALEEDASVTVCMGYNGILEEVFYGNLTREYNSYERADEILFKDRMLLLEKVWITDTYLNCTPQDIIEDGLRKAGITQYSLDRMAFPTKSVVSIRQKNMVDVLKQINSLWGIQYHGTFIKGIFYWGVKPEQKEIYEFEYADNILTLNREGGLWELVTVAMPFIQHSQIISVIHPKVTGEFEVEKVVSFTNPQGFTRTSIYFDGG